MRPHSSNEGYKDQRLVAKTPGQKEFIKTICSHDVTICTGPPGTGKTHIACGLAAQAMRHKLVEKIILCRPTGQIEGDIGFLPGGIREKLGPYLVPLFDELSCYMSYELIKHLMDVGRLEIVPLSAMRGRTFKDCYVVLDEAQNATYKDLKMFFTRFGHNSKVIASGDIHQSDLSSKDSGSLSSVIDRVHHIEGVGICHLNYSDVVRHPLTSAFDQVL
jgi:phosphate starvation-inducible PhoH-like protein